jgi:hypothetical protein
MNDTRDKQSKSDIRESTVDQDGAQGGRDNERRRTLLKAGWALPVVTMVPLPQESAMAQTGFHTDFHGDHSDSGHTDTG